MKKKSARHKHPVSLLKMTVVVIFLSAYLFMTIYFRPFFIKDINCNSDEGECDEPVLAELNHLQTKFFFSPQITTTVTKIIRSDPYISEIQVQHQFPHTIIFSIHKKKPVAEIQCENENLLVNSDGKVEENTRLLRLDTTTVQAAQSICMTLIDKGSVDLNTINELINFAELIKKTTPDLNAEWTDETTAVVQNTLHQRIILPINQLQSSFQMYQYLLDQNQLTEGWTELDLRFQKAIVKTQ
ncbi:MAG: hypothetical protein ABI425_00575 [Patescibacteria group bacterium]